VRLIGAYRDSERTADAGLQEFVADLARESRVQVLRLEPLADAAAARLITERMPEGTEPAVVVPAIVRRAGGVPFFLISYLENLRPDETGEAELSLPWTVAQVIRQRVVALPAPAQELLGVAAAVGRVMSHSLLVCLTGRSDEEVIEALETAVDARLLAEDAQSGYRFAHDLIRETIEDGLSAGRRRLLHRRIGEALEGDPRSSPELLAFHFTLGDDDAKAITYIEEAGDQAQLRVAHTTAAILFQQAIDRLERMERSEDAVRLYEKLGGALYRSAHNDEAIVALERAHTGYLAAGDEDGGARVIVRLVDAHFRRGTSEDDMARSLGLADSGHGSGATAAFESNRLPLEGVARLLFANPSPPRMLAVGRSLTRAGRQTGDQSLQMRGTRVQAAGLIELGRVAEGAALLETTIPRDPVADRDERAVELAVLLSAAYLVMGALDRSQTLSQRMLAGAESTGDEVVAAMHTVILAAVQFVQGDWSRGRDLLRGALERSTAAGPSAMMVRLTGIVAKCLIWDGRREEARSHLEASLERSRSMRIDATERGALVDLAALDLLEGRPEAALSRTQLLLAGDHSWEYVVSLFSTVAEAYLQLEDLERARSHARRAMAEARRTECWVTGAHALEIYGLVEARAGDGDAARAAYVEGLQRARNMPFPYGEARLLYACGLLDQQEGDRVSGETKRADALAILDRLGAAQAVNDMHLLASPFWPAR
jgi:tetratricopeptide (TPR) repeat protein